MRGIAVLFTLLASVLHPSPGRAVTFGFNDARIQDNIPDTREAQLLSGVGAQIHRFTFNWRFAEQRRGQYSFGIYDSIYRADMAQGIRPLLVLMYAPNWALPRHTPCLPTQLCQYAPDKRHLKPWRGIVRTLVKRYPRLAAIEIWNEPNLMAFWHPFPNPKRYAMLVRAAHRAARRAHSHVPILAGSLADANEVVPTIPGMRPGTFLAGMLRRHLVGHFDGLSIHPYPRGVNLAPMFRALTEVDQVRARFGDRSPIWVTEVGASTSGEVSEAQQAALLVRVLELLGARPDIHAVLIHTLFDPPDASGNERGYGVLTTTGTVKPSYCALAALRLRTPSQCSLGLLRPSPDPDQEARWDAQSDVQGAVDAAVTYIHHHHGSLKGFSTGGPQPHPNQMPGPSADPARVGTFAFGHTTLLCAASRADSSYCALYAGSWTYGNAVGPIGAAANATLNGRSHGW
jgi:hypothetical protein